MSGTYFFNLQYYVKKTNFREDFEKYSKDRHFTVKGYQIINFCVTIELWENFLISGL